jgi:hypothetical protein
MNNYIGVYSLARVIAAERTNTARREPIVLERPGGLWRDAVSEISHALDAFNKALLAPAREYTYCTFNPSEC